MKGLKKKSRIYVGVLQPATVLKMTGCFLVISEAVVLMCSKNHIYRKFLGKNLPLLVKFYHQHDRYTTQRCVATYQLFFVIPLFNKKLHKKSLLYWFDKQPFNRGFKHFLKFFMVNPSGTFLISDNMYQNIVVTEIRNFYNRNL